MSKPSQHPEDRRRRQYERQRRQKSPSNSTFDRNVYEQLRGAIRRGDISIDTPLVESELIDLLDSTRNAVRRALQMLALDGLIHREPRVGTSVQGRPMIFNAGNILPQLLEPAPGDPSKSSDFRAVEIETIEDGLIPQGELIGTALQSRSNEVHQLVQRIKISDKTPIYVRVGYTEPIPNYTRLIDSTRQGLPSIEETFQILFGTEIGERKQFIYAESCRPWLSRMLRIKSEAPVLVREMLIYDINGKPRELSFTYYRGDRVTMTAQLR